MNLPHCPCAATRTCYESGGCEGRSRGPVAFRAAFSILGERVEAVGVGWPLDPGELPLARVDALTTDAGPVTERELAARHGRTLAESLLSRAVQAAIAAEVVS
jgi:hypothetical protein